jgi:hypothetical protein
MTQTVSNYKGVVTQSGTGTTTLFTLPGTGNGNRVIVNSLFLSATMAASANTGYWSFNFNCTPSGGYAAVVGFCLNYNYIAMQNLIAGSSTLSAWGSTTGSYPGVVTQAFVNGGNWYSSHSSSNYDWSYSGNLPSAQPSGNTYWVMPTQFFASPSSVLKLTISHVPIFSAGKTSYSPTMYLSYDFTVVNES